MKRSPEVNPSTFAEPQVPTNPHSNMRAFAAERYRIRVKPSPEANPRRSRATGKNANQSRHRQIGSVHFYGDQPTHDCQENANAPVAVETRQRSKTLRKGTSQDTHVLSWP